MRPFEQLPLPAPKDYDPSPVWFYQNMCRHFIPDMIQMMNTGLHIDQEAVENLRNTVTDVLANVDAKLANNKLIQGFMEHIRPEAQDKHRQKATKSLRTVEYYLKPFKDTAEVRTWVLNTYLAEIGKQEDIRDNWTKKNLVTYSEYSNDPFLLRYASGTLTTDDESTWAYRYAEHKVYLWNKVRLDKAEVPVTLDPINLASTQQKQKLFAYLGVEPLSETKSGNASWSRKLVESLRESIDENDTDLLEIIDCIVDHSYSAIIRNNFLSGFDKYTIDGVLRGSVSLAGTKTFRLTSNKINLLNMPSTASSYAKPLKKCFTAPEGYVVLTADLSSLEDRMIANVTKDPNKLALFTEGLDGHSLHALMYGYPELQDLFKEYQAASTPEERKRITYYVKENFEKIRQHSKSITFKLS